MRGLYVCVDEEGGKGGTEEREIHTHSKRDRQTEIHRWTDRLNSLYSSNAPLIVFMEIQSYILFPSIHYEITL